MLTTHFVSAIIDCNT